MLDFDGRIVFFIDIDDDVHLYVYGRLIVTTSNGSSRFFGCVFSPISRILTQGESAVGLPYASSLLRRGITITCRELFFGICHVLLFHSSFRNEKLFLLRLHEVAEYVDGEGENDGGVLLGRDRVQGLEKRKNHSLLYESIVLEKALVQ